MSPVARASAFANRRRGGRLRTGRRRTASDTREDIEHHLLGACVSTAVAHDRPPAKTSFRRDREADALGARDKRSINSSTISIAPIDSAPSSASTCNAPS
jgi:hypothetical protein